MKNLHHLFSIIIKHRVILFWVVILLLFGFTLWRVQTISNPRPDPGYLRGKQRALETQKITIDKELEEQIQQLLKTPVDVTPDRQGTSDPFNP